ncbi:MULTISPECIES: hypothetical protein [Pseudomonas]|uniref:hypothetical protein n=1 Tax=Pseudomonas TaxID=286 RepID=UPI0030D92B3F
MILFYVMNEFGNGVGFLSKADADYASTGIAHSMYVNQLAVAFRESEDAEPGQVFPIKEIVLPDEIAKN